jgi:uncharacterized protein (TIGR00162 family)
MNVEIKILKEITTKDSILISGLPGIAHIGKLSINYLIQELKAKIFGKIYSRFFPPYVLIGKNGVVEMLKNELYYWEGDKRKRIFFFTGNTQASSPEGQYDIANKVLDTVIDLGVKKVFSIAAFLTPKSFEKPRVFGTTTTPSLIEEMKGYGILPLDQGVISGTNGLIFGLAKKKKLDGICLLGETPGYQTQTGQYLLDAKAVKAVLEILTKILEFKINMDPLDKWTEQMDDLIRRAGDVEKRLREKKQEASDRIGRYIT